LRKLLVRFFERSSERENARVNACISEFSLSPLAYLFKF